MVRIVEKLFAKSSPVLCLPEVSLKFTKNAPFREIIAEHKFLKVKNFQRNKPKCR